jgi:hypothetical protein
MPRVRYDLYLPPPLVQIQTFLLVNSLYLPPFLPKSVLAGRNILRVSLRWLLAIVGLILLLGRCVLNIINQIQLHRQEPPRLAYKAITPSSVPSQVHSAAYFHAAAPSHRCPTVSWMVAKVYFFWNSASEHAPKSQGIFFARQHDQAGPRAWSITPSISKGRYLLPKLELLRHFSYSISHLMKSWWYMHEVWVLRMWF